MTEDRGLSGIMPTPAELANVAAAAAQINAHAHHVNRIGHDARTCLDPRCHRRSTPWSDPEHDVAGDFRRAVDPTYPPCTCPSCQAAQREDSTMSTFRVSMVVEEVDHAGVSRKVVGGTVDHPSKGGNPAFLAEQMVEAVRATAADLVAEIAKGDPRAASYL